MKRFLNKKGFTLVELIVVMAILAVLVLLAAPRFMNYRAEAVLTQVKSDTRAIENSLEAYTVKNNNKLPDGLEVVDITSLDTAISEGRLYDYKGGVDSYIGSNFYKVGDTLNSKLKGYFVVSDEGKVYYVHNKSTKTEEESSLQPHIPEGYTLATDSDFQYITDYFAPNTYEGGQKGYYKYVGPAEYVTIPHTINGNIIKDYYSMFDNSPVKGVASNNPNVTNMSWMFYNNKATTLDLSSFNTSNVTNMSNMFQNNKATTLNLSSFDTSNVTNMGSMFEGSQATTLDLSSFDTSKVTNMSYMFYYSQATTLDLSSFDTSSVTNMGYMFYDSQATTGYARTTADADKFNASSNKPAGLTFVVK